MLNLDELEHAINTNEIPNNLAEAPVSLSLTLFEGSSLGKGMKRKLRGS
jgi:hypothetical protein